jgi:hypothetical protein
MSIAASTPLWPAGHLPLKGGDWQLKHHGLLTSSGNWRDFLCKPISPLEGEMAGRPEGGVSTSLNLTR